MRHASLYQINTRVWLAEVSRRLGRPATLDDVPDQALDWMVGMGFEWVWFLSVWQTGEASRRVSLSHAEWRHEFEATLPDLRDEDITGSGFAISGYTVHHDLGGDAALGRLRERMAGRGLRLMLDFVPNHTALDHSWIHEHPEYFVRGTELLTRAPQNYTWVRRPEGDLLLAHGRDPFFDGWPDTLQLNYGHPGARAAMIEELLRIAGQCDGVRCDMAMLVLPDVFERTWGIPAEPFWPEAMQTVRERHPKFCFMAEVYWDLEWTLQQQGFDYTYDKRLYDRLREGRAGPVREHLKADLAYQEKSARFLENHDEARAAVAFAPGQDEAAAVVTYLLPGLRFFHQGQFTGRLKRISPHLGRGPVEPIDLRVREFYQHLLAVLRRADVRDGEWRLLEGVSAWEGNHSWDAYVAFVWQGVNGRLLVVVNYAPHQSQCYLRLPFADIAGAEWRLSDLMSDTTHDRAGAELAERGLYLDLGPWQYHVFDLKRADARNRREEP